MKSSLSITLKCLFTIPGTDWSFLTDWTHCSCDFFCDEYTKIFFFLRWIQFNYLITLLHSVACNVDRSCPICITLHLSGLNFNSHLTIVQVCSDLPGESLHPHILLSLPRSSYRLQTSWCYSLSRWVNLVQIWGTVVWRLKNDHWGIPLMTTNHSKNFLWQRPSSSSDEENSLKLVSCVHVGHWMQPTFLFTNYTEYHSTDADVAATSMTATTWHEPCISIELHSQGCHQLAWVWECGIQTDACSPLSISSV